MRVYVAAEERVGSADSLVEELRRRGFELLLHGALTDEERDDWAWASEAAARDVAAGRAEQAIVCCWTAPVPRSRRIRWRAFARPSAGMRRRPPAPAVGTTPTPSPSASEPPPSL